MRIKIKKRREILWKRNPHCYYCDKYLPFEETTLEHIYSKVKTGKREIPLNEKGDTVLSCSDCNQQRAIDERDSLPRWTVWYRSKAFPRIYRKDLSLIERFIILYYGYMLRYNFRR